MRRFLLALLVAFNVSPTYAQEPVRRWADWASYGTAIVNPTMAVADAIKAPDTRCRLTRLALSEVVGNTLSLTLKHFIVSPRPCLGCDPDGMPSGHTMNATIGASSWRGGALFSISTADLRIAARRHTRWQTMAGAGIGILGEASGRLISCGGK